MSKIDFKEWNNFESLEFKEETFGEIRLPLSRESISDGIFDFSTELIFRNCLIDSFNISALILEKPVKFIGCKIGRLSCHSTYFIGGIEVNKCIVEKESTFDCGVHNKYPNWFIIKNSIFNEHLDFFDAHFGGPILVANNNFQGGTSLDLYVPTADKKRNRFEVVIKNNEGDLSKYSKTDPFKPSK